MVGSDEFIFHIMSIVIISITSCTSIIIAIKNFNVYKENKQFQPLIVAVASFLISIAMILLSIEKYYLSIAINESLGMLYGAIAIIISVIAVIATECFALNISYLEKFKTLTGIAAIFGGILIGFWMLDPTREVVAGEITFGDWWGIGFPITDLVILIVCIPLMLILITSMFYYAKKIWKEDPLLGKRLLIFSLGAISLAIGYGTELIGFEPIISTFLRMGFPVASILFYWALFKMK